MFGWRPLMMAMLVVTTMSAGCMSGIDLLPNGGSTGVADLAAKATEVASHVGGADGFGGTLMDGYMDHMPNHMGFDGTLDLAGADSHMMVVLRNESDQDGTFHLSYIASHMGLAEQETDVVVGAGDDVTVEIPCSEIVGIGSLDTPGALGCYLGDGETIGNTMSVPGFLGQDFTCNGTYSCVLVQDVNDLDGDGDTQELIILSDAMNFHMMNGGPLGHMHGTGSGMMGSHMGF